MLEVIFSRKKTLRLNFLTGSLLGRALGTCGEMKKVGFGQKEKLGCDIVTTEAQVLPWGYLVLKCPCRVVPVGEWRPDLHTFMWMV